jgi:membrane-associated phospholipid phosphatase
MDFVKYFYDAIIRDLTVLGSLVFYLILLAAFVQTPLFTVLFIGLIVMYAVNIPLKLIMFKQRPNKMKYKKLWEKIEASSFPSVHAERATFLALFFINAYDNFVLSSLVLVLAALVCYSRVHLKKHYWTDVFAGIILGVAIFAAVSMI